MFAGGAGAAYGHGQVWQFFDPERGHNPMWNGDTIIGWHQGINAKAAYHIHHLKDLMLSRPDFNRVEDNNLIVSDRGEDYTDAIIATRNIKGTYAMVYLPQPNPIEIDLDILKNGRKKVSWFNPVTGKYTALRRNYRSGVQTFTPPDKNQKDWVLVIDVR